MVFSLWLNSSEWHEIFIISLMFSQLSSTKFTRFHLIIHFYIYWLYILNSQFFHQPESQYVIFKVQSNANVVQHFVSFKAAKRLSHFFLSSFVQNFFLWCPTELLNDNSSTFIKLQCYAYFGLPLLQNIR